MPCLINVALDRYTQASGYAQFMTPGRGDPLLGRLCTPFAYAYLNSRFENNESLGLASWYGAVVAQRKNPGSTLPRLTGLSHQKLRFVDTVW